MKRIIIPIWLLVAVCGVQAAANSPESAGLTVAISIPAEGAFGGSNEWRALSFRAPSAHFHVVVSNISTNDIRLWKEDCSWGYEALSLKIQDSAGKQWTARKKPRSWRSNYPRWWLLKPDDTLIVDVHFAESAVWYGFNRPAKGSNLELTLTAVYEIQPDQRSQEHQIWTGKIVSKPIGLTFYD